jgi:hypothetical protein
VSAWITHYLGLQRVLFFFFLDRILEPLTGMA